MWKPEIASREMKGSGSPSTSFLRGAGPSKASFLRAACSFSDVFVAESSHSEYRKSRGSGSVLGGGLVLGGALVSGDPLVPLRAVTEKAENFSQLVVSRCREGLLGVCWSVLL